jgi:hypothetical protein
VGKHAESEAGGGSNPAAGLFTLIDCGAWIEQCIAGGETNPMPSAQIAALSANEARIYQLAPR